MRRLSVIIASALLLVGCAVPQRELVILHLNDTHSHHEPMRPGDRREGQGGVIERAAIIDSVYRSRGEDNVLLLHAGDFNQGSSYYNVLGGKLEVDLVNAMGYDCIALGNHEFDNGLEDLAERVENIDAQILCCNVDFTGTPLEALVAGGTVVEKAGIRIGVIGATSNLKSNVAYETSSRVTQLDNAESINGWAEYLRYDECCDLVILLSHLGYHEDQEIVPSLHNVDLIIGGHSHTFVDGFVVVEDADGFVVPIIQDGCWGYEVGEITVKL